MKAIILSLAALAAADLGLNYSDILAAPLPSVTVAPVIGKPGSIPFNSAAVASSLTGDVQPTSAPAANKVKRTECAIQPAGAGPTPSPDTDVAFQSDDYWHFLADVQLPPFPYVEKFRDLNGSTQQNSYITYFVLPAYNASLCADHCDKNNLCTAFNIYVERDPAVEPGPDCPNPPSTENYKCALWGSSISKATATNVGQYRENFHVVIAGSNGYEKTNFTLPPIAANFTIVSNLTNQVITNVGNFLGSKFFAGPYDPTLCSFYATAQTSANRDEAEQQGLDSYSPANMFNSYFVYKNEVAWGTACSLFDVSLDGESAGDVDGSDGDDFYSVGSSWTYELDPQDDGTL